MSMNNVMLVPKGPDTIAGGETTGKESFFSLLSPERVI